MRALQIDGIFLYCALDRTDFINHRFKDINGVLNAKGRQEERRQEER